MAEQGDESGATSAATPAENVGQAQQAQQAERARIQNGNDIFKIVESKRVFSSPGSSGPANVNRPSFAMDTYVVQERTPDSDWRQPEPRYVFERGDSVGVLLYNRTSDKVIVVEQPRLPIVGKVLGKDEPIGRFAKRPSEGWLVETIAGAVQPGEEPRVAAQRAVQKETGYDPKIEQFDHIASYFSSPGGTSEAIHLFYAEVLEGDPRKTVTGLVKTHDLKLDDFSKLLKNGSISDPKLLVAFYYLQARLGIVPDVSEPLPSGHDKRSYIWTEKGRSIEIGFKTGDILEVKDVDVWLNPENKFLMLSRIVDGGISASIRWGGAEKYFSQTVIVDRISNDLHRRIGNRRPEVTDIIETEPGALGQSNNVRRLLHLPLAQPRSPDNPRDGVAVRKEDIRPAVLMALEEIQRGNLELTKLVRKFGRSYCTSVLVPLIGTGEGKLPARVALPEIVAGIDKFMRKASHSTIEKVWLLVYHDRDLKVCIDHFEELLKKWPQLKRG